MAPAWHQPAARRHVLDHHKMLLEVRPDSVFYDGAASKAKAEAAGDWEASTAMKSSQIASQLNDR